MMGALTAIEIILARYLSVQTETFRLGFETIPLGLAGLWLGPAAGALVALAGDVLGTVLFGYGVYFPPLSLGPVVFGAVCGLGGLYLRRRGARRAWKVAAVAVLAGVLNSFVFGLFGMALYQTVVMGRGDAFTALLAADLVQRLVTKPATIAASAAAISLVDRAAYRPVVAKLACRPAGETR